MGIENNAVEMKTRSSVQINRRNIVKTAGEITIEIQMRFAIMALFDRQQTFHQKNHLQYITKNKSYTYRRVLFECPTKHGLMQCSMQSYHDESSVADPSPFDDPNNHHLMVAGVSVVDHCNGVLCIHKKPDSFFLWNPTTRISIKLPKIEHQTMKYGFGWDEESDAYKVFVGLSEFDKGNKIGKVYSTKTSSWKVVEYGSLSFCRKGGKFASGKIHWLVEGGFGIETFDLKSEVFGIMENPYKPEVGVSMRLYNYYGCLAVLFENNDDTTRRLWVMNEYGAKDSWVKVKVQPGKIITCCYANYYYIESLVSLESEKEL